MLSKNGTEFVGAEKELRQEISKWNQWEIYEALLQKRIDRRFSLSIVSNFGGVWERMIHVIAKLIFSLM
jgi:hypothetical protein